MKSNAIWLSWAVRLFHVILTAAVLSSLLFTDSSKVSVLVFLMGIFGLTDIRAPFRQCIPAMSSLSLSINLLVTALRKNLLEGENLCVGILFLILVIASVCLYLTASLSDPGFVPFSRVTTVCFKLN